MAAVLFRQPWSLHQEFFNEVNRRFDRTGANDATVAEWAPSVDIEETAERFLIRADVPGVDPASIEITLEKGVLSLSGVRQPEADKTGVERRHSERAAGRFHRRFALPDTVDGDSVSASGKHGVLEVVIPKRAPVQPRRISVSA